MAQGSTAPPPRRGHDAAEGRARYGRIESARLGQDEAENPRKAESVHATQQRTIQGTVQKLAHRDRSPSDCQ